MAPLRRTPDGHPMAPPREEWEALDEAGRDAVAAALPGEVTDAEMSPPEGDLHFKGKARALDALRNYFKRQRRKIYLAPELPVYYPAEPRFAPDLLAVLDAEDHDRSSWFVDREGKGLDWILDVHVGGDRKKDAERNVARYARLGVAEYFVYDRTRGRLAAYRLASGATTYTSLIPQGGLYTSSVLGLDVAAQKDRLRLLLESEELIGRLERIVEEAGLRADRRAVVDEEARLLRDLVVEAHRGRVGLVRLPVHAGRARGGGGREDLLDERATDALAALVDAREEILQVAARCDRARAAVEEVVREAHEPTAARRD